MLQHPILGTNFLQAWHRMNRAHPRIHRVEAIIQFLRQCAYTVYYIPYDIVSADGGNYTGPGTLIVVFDHEHVHGGFWALDDFMLESYSDDGMRDDDEVIDVSSDESD